MKKENLDWIKENRETVLGQLVLYSSPVNLAEMVLDNSLWNDHAVEKMRLKLEKSEGLLTIEKDKRKAAAAKKPKIVKETEDERNQREAEEKRQKQLEAQEKKKKMMEEDFTLPDDDWRPEETEESMDDFPDFGRA